ncbi:MAG TPA: type II toxin-antitoxin system VapC family toxin [Terracidiphilus sp.]|nr:type II toxin-antitoxin system VapC family toxin [Terracidiphilus sp.]
MKITADTNLLVRAAVRDDRRQAAAASRLLRSAERIAIPLPALCEFVWVLDRVYDFNRNDTADAITALLNTSNLAIDRSAVEAGLAVLRSGGDFADGVIAYTGHWLGGEIFASFDRAAVRRLDRLGYKTHLLA